ncbi:MAG: Ig-like domain repeat protein, partial [Actinobacteria bacterium]|nr:Ig-like domain repeat protein [Actinomycetota bacterium]
MTPTFPTPVTVGQKGLPASLQIVNAATPPESTGTVTLNLITLVPSCGTDVVGPPTGDCPLANADPGVFTLSSTAVGEAGTACAGITFTVMVIDPATGQVQFIPSAPVVLTPPGTPNSICRIDFTVDVNKVPSNPQAVLSPTSFQTAVDAFVIGTSNVTGFTARVPGNQPVIVNKAIPSIVTMLSPMSITLGSSFTDTATLTPAAGAPAPTGTVTFNVFAPGDTTCATPILFSTNPITGNQAVSGSFTPTSANAAPYQVVATYNGDANNAPVSSACGAEPLTVTPSRPSIVTLVSPTSITLGSSFTDTATVTPAAGGVAPTGTVTFNVFAPGDTTCATPIFTSASRPLSAGSATSGSFTPTSANAAPYQVVATYNGDANNASVSSRCGDEPLVVNPRPVPVIAITKAATPPSQPAP